MNAVTGVTSRSVQPPRPGAREHLSKPGSHRLSTDGCLRLQPAESRPAFLISPALIEGAQTELSHRSRHTYLANEPPPSIHSHSAPRALHQSRSWRELCDERPAPAGPVGRTAQPDVQAGWLRQPDLRRRPHVDRDRRRWCCGVRKTLRNWQRAEPRRIDAARILSH